MKSLSIKVKVPLIFSLVILLTFAFSIIVLSFFSIKRIEENNIQGLIQFAGQSSYEILIKDIDSLTAKMNIWMRNDRYIKSMMVLDQNFRIIAHPRRENINKIVDKEIIEILVENDLGEGNYLTADTKNGEILFWMPLKVANVKLGFFIAVVDRAHIIDILKTAGSEIKASIVIIFLISAVFIILAAYFSSMMIVDPILSIIDYINKYTYSNPIDIKPLPLKNQPRCWEAKKCKDKECKYYENTNAYCWEKYFNLSNLKKVNPMSFPCYDCAIFQRKESNEIERLKLFLNQLISSIQFHYQKNKLYSTTLEEMIDERTKELQAETIKSFLIIDNIVEGTLVTDLDGNVVQYNNMAKQLLNLRVDDEMVAGVGLEALIENQDVCVRLRKIIEETSVKDCNIVEEIAAETGKDVKYLVVKTTLVKEPDHSFNMVVCLIEDITASKMLDKFKNDFFHTLSHDLNNPLTTVMGFIDLVLNGKENKKLTEKQRTHLNVALKNSGELREMISDLRSLVKLQTGSINLNKMQFVLNHFFDDLDDTFYPKMEKNNVKLNKKITPSTLQITADYYRLKQVFSNLIENAIKASKDITITLEGWEEEKSTFLVVSDDGPGIPPNKLPFIFEKFMQLDTYKDNTEGLGLGLSIVKNLISLHNGTVTVDSEVNKGTRFTIVLPKV